MNERSFNVKCGSEIGLPLRSRRRWFVNRPAFMSAQGVTLSLPTELVARFPPTRRYLVGVSGGRDSVALLDALINAGYRRLVVCHLDHQLRGRASTVDAKF